MDRTMKVTGKGKISVKPDTIRLMISQNGTKREYPEAVKESARQKKELNDVLESAGLKTSDLKTLSFDINIEYESYQEKGSWKRKFKGYSFNHRMKVEFPLNNEILGRVLSAISNCPGHPEFSIFFTVDDPEAKKNELLGKAIADSKNKAEVMAGASGVTLGKIMNIDYSWGEVELFSRCMDLGSEVCEAKSTALMDIDLEADDIDLTDTVTVIWELI